MSTFAASDARPKQTTRHPTTDIFKPLQWLHRAWRVVLAAPAVSAALGIGFTILCASAYAAADALPLFTATFATLLLAVSPFFAAAAYAAAMQVSRGQQPTLAGCAYSVAGRALSIGIFATLCGLLMAAWVRLAGLSFALYYNTLGLSGTEVTRVWFAGDAPAGLLVFLGAATAVLAAALFTLAVIALPRIVDRDCDVVQAVTTGLRVIKANPLIVAVWSVVLLVTIALALISQLLLMPLVFPVLAYASWFCYADLSRG
jgi:uncharacterized membrane protein